MLKKASFHPSVKTPLTPSFPKYVLLEKRIEGGGKPF